jgi:hypothetical protein
MPRLPDIPPKFRSHKSISDLVYWHSQMVKVLGELSENRYNRRALKDAGSRLRSYEVEILARWKYAHDGFVEKYSEISGEGRSASKPAEVRSANKGKRKRVVIGSSDETDELEEESSDSGGEMDLS